MNALLTRAMFDKAVEILRPAIGVAHGKDIVNKLAGTFVVLDPGSGAVLFEADIDPDHKKADLYRQIARAKAKVSWETGLPSRVVQQDAPYLYEVGDVKWGGSVVRGVGPRKLVVAFSGVQAIFDEMFAGWLADALIAFCREAMAEIMKPEHDDEDYMVLAM